MTTGYLKIDLAGRGEVEVRELVLDFNGTLATDGILRANIAQRIRTLSEHVRVSVLTADTFGTAEKALAGLPARVFRVETGHDKAEFVSKLGAKNVAVIGNGRNDLAMTRLAALGIAVIGREGAAGDLLREADVVVHDIADALDLLLKPLRLRATLRS